MDCPLCKIPVQKLYHIKRFKPTFKIFRCSQCGLQMQDSKNSNIESIKKIEKLYTKDYYLGDANYHYQDERNSKKYQNFVWQARLKKIARFIPAPADFLDIGCAFGGFVEAANKFDYRGVGLDISPYAVASAKAQGLNVTKGYLKAGVFPKASFDIVTLVEVLEHLPNPRHVVQCLSDIVRPGGLVLIQTANFLAWQARLAKGNYHYYLPGHLFYYSTNNLRTLFEEYGFGKFIFFNGTDFGLFPKLCKSRGQFNSTWDYLQYFRIACYHYMSRLGYKDFALTSSMVMYAFRL